MSQQQINTGVSLNDGTGDTLRSAGSKINANFSELYSQVSALNLSQLPPSSSSTLGGVIIPAVGTSGITNSSGTIGLATATTSQLGAVRIDGNTILIDQDGAISARTSTYTLPAATTQTLGGVKIDGATITINQYGIISASGAYYTLPTATTTVLGGVKVDGTTIQITNGVISGTTSYSLPIASASTLGGVKVDGTTISINNGVINTNVTGLTSRTSSYVTTASLTANGSGTYNITGYKGYALVSIQVSAGAWVTVYASAAAQSADSSRSINTDPTPGSGVIAEIITTTATTQYFSPAVIGYSSEIVPNTSIPVKIYNNSGNTATITVTLTLIKLEI
jgi:hypothetical protein